MNAKKLLKVACLRPSGSFAPNRVPIFLGDFGEFEEKAGGVVTVPDGLALPEEVLSGVDSITTEGAFGAGCYVSGHMSETAGGGERVVDEFEGGEADEGGSLAVYDVVVVKDVAGRVS